jgi:hypothetical protein
MSRRLKLDIVRKQEEMREPMGSTMGRKLEVYIVRKQEEMRQYWKQRRR